MADLHRRLVQANLPNDVVVIAQRELKRIKRLQPSSSEWAVSRNYLEWLADIPWSSSTKQILDIQKSKRQLDSDHFGLEHVKKRIIEYLSVIKIKGDLKAPILCLVGPVSSMVFFFYIMRGKKDDDGKKNKSNLLNHYCYCYIKLII
jgi:ATP-dependent Lon protease